LVKKEKLSILMIQNLLKLNIPYQKLPFYITDSGINTVQILISKYSLDES